MTPTETNSATKPDPVTTEGRKAWLRDNIHETEDGWAATEVTFQVPPGVTQDDLETHFDWWWEHHEDGGQLDEYEARLARIEQHLWPARTETGTDPETAAPSFTDYGGIWPAGGLLADGGQTWRNITNVPLTSAPSQFPGNPRQWSHLFELVTTEYSGESEPTPEPGVPNFTQPTGGHDAYSIGDRVLFEGGSV